MNESQCNKKVAIILSYFKGESFIEAQLESIANQIGGWKVTVFIRNDNPNSSLDAVLKNSYGLNIVIIDDCRLNLGPKDSFFYLLEYLRVGKERFDYIALCDQDDIWMQHKLERAFFCLESEGKEFYCSSVALFYGYDKKVNYYSHGLCTYPDFNKALIKNFATGCTIMFRWSFLTKVQTRIADPSILMHDWWLFLIASSIDCVYYDRIPTVLYRQHQNNVIGLSVGLKGLVTRTLYSFLRRPNIRYRQYKTFCKAMCNHSILKCLGPFEFRIKLIKVAMEEIGFFRSILFFIRG